jgi:hypothetical protein
VVPPALHPDVVVLAEPGRTLVPGTTDKALRRGSFNSVPDLIAAIQAYLDAHNEDPQPFIWTATADSILEKVRRGRVALQQVVGQ